MKSVRVEDRVVARALYLKLVDKSIESAIAAIEVYNKPSFGYREENFSILIINAWELLLKAKILHDNNGKIKSIYVMEYRDKKDGTPTKRKYPALNRSKNPTTIGLSKAIELCIHDARLAENLYSLLEIRDNATHFVVKQNGFGRVVRDVGTATLKSFMVLCEEWFNRSLDKFNFYMMPIGFYDELEFTSVPMAKNTARQNNFYNHIGDVVARHPSDVSQKHNVILSTEMKLKKASDETVYTYKYDKDSPNTLRQEKLIAIQTSLKDGSLMSYSDFTQKLKEKVPGFKINKIFYEINSNLKAERQFTEEYPRDVANNSNPQYFYKQQAITELVKIYEKEAKND